VSGETPFEKSTTDRDLVGAVKISLKPNYREVMMKSVLESHNLTVDIDDANKITLEIDGNRLLARKGEINGAGRPRKQDQVATSGGWMLLGPYKISLNISRG
jgi:hypothetical protein